MAGLLAAEQCRHERHSDNQAEAVAILLADTDRAERQNDRPFYEFGRKGLLRNDHGAPNSVLASPSPFLPEPGGRHDETVRGLLREQPETARRIALAPVVFTLLREKRATTQPKRLFDRCTAKSPGMRKADFSTIAIERPPAKVTQPVLTRWQAELGRPVPAPLPAHAAPLPA